jgi:hypothetical protein
VQCIANALPTCCSSSRSAAALTSPAVGPQRRLVGQAQVAAQPSQDHAGTDSARVLQYGAAPRLHSGLDGLLRYLAGWLSACTLAIPLGNHGRLVQIDQQPANCPAGHSVHIPLRCTRCQLGAAFLLSAAGLITCALLPAPPGYSFRCATAVRCIITSCSKRRGAVLKFR